MWDERYGEDDYAYGKEPNNFLEDNHHVIPKGKVLSLAEGEGRNAVFLAKLGYKVTAVDGSKVGLNKAERLAKEHGLDNIEFVHADLASYEIGEQLWHGIISIFCPLPPTIRSQVYKNAVRGLKMGGVFLLEAYRPEQLHRDTGGGKSPDNMTCKTSLLADLHGLTFTHVSELDRNIIEGQYHTGIGSVVQVIASK